MGEFYLGTESQMHRESDAELMAAAVGANSKPIPGDT